MNRLIRIIKLSFARKLDYLESYLSRPKLRILKTVYLNLRVVGIKNFLKFPILVYGKFEICRIGNIRIETSQLQRGLIRFGLGPKKYLCPTRIVNLGTITFYGRADIWGGVYLELGKEAELKIGEQTLLGENVRIMLRKKCVIGHHARIAFDSQIMDSDFHYLLDIEDRTIKNCTSEVIIGNYNWIGNRTTIKKGVKTPDHTTVAGPYAMLNKDYTKICSKNPILGGCPAKQLASGFIRILNPNVEHELTRCFVDGKDKIILDDSVLEEDCYLIH